MNAVDLSDKIIFMTGVTSGLGKVAACEMAQNGATDFFSARTNWATMITKF